MQDQKRMVSKELIIGVLKMFPDEKQLRLICDVSPIPGVQLVLSLPDEGFVTIDTPEKVRKVLDFRYQTLERANSINEIFYWIHKPSRLDIFYLITHLYSMEKETYNEILKDIWISTEFPHQMPIPRLTKLFRQADAELLMNKDEKSTLKALPETVTVYRGLIDKRAKLRGLSWTLKREIADWFANRFHRGEVYQAEINKKHIFMFTNERSEHECVINPRGLKNVRCIGKI